MLGDAFLQGLGKASTGTPLATDPHRDPGVSTLRNAPWQLCSADAGPRGSCQLLADILGAAAILSPLVWKVGDHFAGHSEELVVTGGEELRMVRGAQRVTDNTLVCFFLGLKAWQALRRSLGVRGLPLRALCKGISKANPMDACFHMQKPFFFFFAKAFEAV